MHMLLRRPAALLADIRHTDTFDAAEVGKLQNKKVFTGVQPQQYFCTCRQIYAAGPDSRAEDNWRATGKHLVLGYPAHAGISAALHRRAPRRSRSPSGSSHTAIKSWNGVAPFLRVTGAGSGGMWLWGVLCARRIRCAQAAASPNLRLFIMCSSRQMLPSWVPDVAHHRAGYVEQFDTMLPELSVREMLLYTAELKYGPFAVAALGNL